MLKFKKNIKIDEIPLMFSLKRNLLKANLMVFRNKIRTMRPLCNLFTKYFNHLYIRGYIYIFVFHENSTQYYVEWAFS